MLIEITETHDGDGAACLCVQDVDSDLIILITSSNERGVGEYGDREWEIARLTKEMLESKRCECGEHATAYCESPYLAEIHPELDNPLRWYCDGCLFEECMDV